MRGRDLRLGWARLDMSFANLMGGLTIGCRVGIKYLLAIGYIRRVYEETDYGRIVVGMWCLLPEDNTLWHYN
jgi:hypothetical protein